MNEVFCVMEYDGDPNDIMPTLFAIYSTVEGAMGLIKTVMEMDDKVLLRVERWDVDGSTSNRVEMDADVLADQTSDLE